MNRKKFLLVKIIIVNLKIRYLIWRYAELNRLLVGSGLIQLNIELQQEDRTVCLSAWRRRKVMGGKGSLSELMNEWINDEGVCRAAPGFARVC